MMLEKIAEERKRQLNLEMQRVPLREVLGKIHVKRRGDAFVKAIGRPGLSIIAEIKRASPSRGAIRLEVEPALRAQQYALGGASAVSVLTEPRYFRGGFEDIEAVRRETDLPILCKDFIVDDYQIYRAAAAGADAVLLIADLHDGPQLIRFRQLAETLGMAVLIEAHSPDALRTALGVSPQVIGINNRDLNTFQVKLETTEKLAKRVPKGLLLVSESGIHSERDAKRMAEAGAHGVLVGEALMLTGNPADTIRTLKGAVA